MKLMTYQELLIEIEDTKKAIEKTKSQFSKRDRRKYLEKLLREKRDYERFKSQAA